MSEENEENGKGVGENPPSGGSNVEPPKAVPLLDDLMLAAEKVLGMGFDTAQYLGCKVVQDSHLQQLKNCLEKLRQARFQSVLLIQGKVFEVERDAFRKRKSTSKIRSIQVSYPHLSQFHETLRDLDEKERAEVVFKTEIHFGVEFEFLSKEDMEAIEAEVLEGPTEHPGWTSFSEEMGHKPGVQVRLTFGVLGHSPAEKWLRAFLLERYPGPLTYKVYRLDEPIE